MSAESHGLELGKEYELNIGSSFFTSKPKEAYHLMRYDFKPASIDTTRPAVFEVGENNQCTVTLPNVQDSGSGSSESTYKGGKKPCVKECVLIIDKVTGQITLERITSSIPLKKCRADKQSTMAKAHSEMENMESLEKSSGNIKKMLKGRSDKVEKKNPPPSKSGKDTTSSSSGSGVSGSGSGSAGKSSKPSSQNAPTTTSTPSVPTQASNMSLTSSNTLPSITGNATSSSTTVPVKQHPPSAGTVPPKRQMSSSDMSVSSASSDSSDSDSSDEGGDSLEKQLAATTTTNTPSKPPPPPAPSRPPPPAPSSLPPSKPPPPPAPKSVSSSFGKSETKIEQSPAKQITSSAPLAKEATVKGKEKSFLNTLQSDLQLSDSDSDSD